MRPFILAVLFLAPLLRAQNPATTTVTIDIENYVEYLEDVADPAKYASTNTLTPAVPLRNFLAIAGIADIVAINGQPAKGTASWRGWILGFSPNPTIDFAIADTARTSIRYWTLEVLKTDGTQVGTIQAEGPNGPPAAPGAPAALTTGSYAVLGGTGAFLGVRGQMGQIRTPDQVVARQASMLENPNARRVNGGGKIRLGLLLLPIFSPQILTSGSSPAVVHSSDYSLVTTAKPAAPGEILSIYATGLGPTTPGTDPGKPFPSSPLANVASQIDVTIGGKAATVLGAVGFPGAVDGYQVNVRVPVGIPSGPATLQLNSSWNPAPPVSISMQ